MDNKIIELLTLKAGIKAIEIIVEGMKADNKKRELLGESLAYDGEDFKKASDNIIEIIKSMHKLANKTGE